VSVRLLSFVCGPRSWSLNTVRFFSISNLIRASYVPVCIAAINADNSITAEPAVVEPLPDEFLDSYGSSPLGTGRSSPMPSGLSVPDMRAEFRKGHSNQFGALNRRHLVSGRHLHTLASEDYQGREQIQRRMPPTRLFSSEDSEHNNGRNEALTPTNTGLAGRSPAVKLSIIGSVRARQTEDGAIEYVVIEGQHDDDDAEEVGREFAA
jgi:hypothetical protein